jgi:hypothetical protein
MALLIYVLWTFDVLIKKRIMFSYSEAVLPVLLYLSLAIVNLCRAVTENPFLAITGFRNMVVFIPMFFIVPYYFKKKDGIRTMIGALFLTGGVVAFLGVYEYFFSPVRAGDVFSEAAGAGILLRRITSTMNYPGTLAMFMMILSLILLSFIMSKNYFINKKVSWSLFGLLVTCLFLTYARGGVITFIVGTAFILYSYKRYQTLLVSFILMIAISVGLYLIVPSVVWRYSRFFERFTSEQSVTMRVSDTASLFLMTEKDPLMFLTGIGIDRVGNVQAAANIVTQSRTFDFVQMDNAYASLYVATGILGPVFLMWIMTALFKEAGHIGNITKDSYFKSLLISLKALILVFALSGFIGATWEQFPINLYFWAFMGLLPAIRHIEMGYNNNE